MKMAMKLREKITAIVLAVVLVVFGSVVGVITAVNRRESMMEARQVALIRSRELANEVRLQFERPLDVARSLAGVLEGLGAAGSLDRALVNGMLAQVLRRNPDFFGVWTCWEPGAFDGRDGDFVGAKGHDGTGRFIPYWYRDGDEVALEALVGYDVPGEGDYYLRAMESGRETVLDPFEYEVGGRKVAMTTLAVPVEIGGRRVGAVGVDIALEVLQEMTTKMRFYETGFGRLLSHGGIVASHPSRDRIGDVAGEIQGAGGDEVLRRIRRGKSWFEESWSVALKQTTFKAFAPVEIGRTGTPWSFGVVALDEEVLAASNRLFVLPLALTGVGLAVVIAAVWLVAGRIVRPLRTVAAMAERAREGDLTVTRDDFALRSSDELGIMADALAAMIGSQADTVFQIRHAAEAVAATSTSLAALSEETNASMDEVRTRLDQVLELSESNGTSIREMASSIQEMADGAQTMARAAVEGATAGERVGRTASASVEKVQAVVRDLEGVGERPRAGAEAMHHLAGAVKDIAGFVGVIGSIADQTNLLALNAAAVRAGAAGRGFAVVAEEVRKLAGESNGAASEVSKLIGSLEKSMGDSIAVTEEAGAIMKATVDRAAAAVRELEEALEGTRRVIDAIGTVASTSEEQAASSEEMASAMEQITEGTTRISGLIRSIGRASEETSRAAEGVAGQAQEMNLRGEELLSRIARFRLDERRAGVLPLSSEVR
ncbi:methyl-accepting chemotaxis protein [Aminirod propionatiphilus]|uniref:Methyl-accepting chemotaxis protein n=1 Tax=Aminirod propionatiphilus TaxID=3415223 RepID=A0ACD1DWQ5_9BACT|nr:methyl-accepting chemotaxis protein [Synergistota bacterium]